MAINENAALEQELLDEAMALDAVEAQALTDFAPAGVYSQNSLNRLVRALNKAMPLFGADPIIELEEDIEGPFPPQLLQPLMMIKSAIGDAALENDLMIDLENLVDDRGVMMVTGVIESAAENAVFRSFLKNPQAMDQMPEVAVEVTNVEMEEELPGGEVVVEDDEDILLARA